MQATVTKCDQCKCICDEHIWFNLVKGACIYVDGVKRDLTEGRYDFCSKECLNEWITGIVNYRELSLHPTQSFNVEEAINRLGGPGCWSKYVTNKKD